MQEIHSEREVRIWQQPINPKKKRGLTYFLYHWVIRKRKDTATIHLHGERNSVLKHKRIEYVTVKFLPGETDAELIRCACAMSPNRWKVKFGVNRQVFGGKFYATLDDRLMSTLTDPSQISSSNE